jgi:bZIP transcription factor
MEETEDLDNTMTARARKRRMQRHAVAAGQRQKKPRMDDDALSSSDEDSLPGTLSMSKDDLAKIPGVKQQARYVPAVPMNKTELTLWRKEARRLRNRESAAASRQKTQGRITELEAEVGALTTKYKAALKRIVELEAAARSSSAWKPPKMAQSPVSPVLEPHPVSPPLSPRESFSLASDEAPRTQSFATMTSQTYPYQATTCKISRPNACVKINNRVVVAI